MVFTLMGEGAMVPGSALVGLALLLDSRYGTRQTGVVMVFPASGGPAFLRDRGPPRRECPPPQSVGSKDAQQPEPGDRAGG